MTGAIDDEIDALAASDDVALAVYADALQQRGDPRGELIALELAGKPIDLSGWLGPTLARQLDTTGSRFARGFVSLVLPGGFVDASSFLAAVLSSPAAPYLREVVVDGEPRWVLKAVRALAAETRRWLTRLVLAERWGDMPRTPLLDADLVAALVAATPRLTTLDIAGSRRIAEHLVHPHVTALHVAGVDALGLHDELPAVTSLDLAFHTGFDTRELPAELVSARRYPALTRLDLSRDEPGSEMPYWLGGRHDAFAFLRRLDVLPQLVELAVPAVATEQNHHDLQVALDAAPRLQRVTIARAYGYPVQLHHPTARIELPSPRPWPPFQDVHGRDALTITVPGDPYGEDVNLRGVVRALEHGFDAMSASAQAAWRELWEFLAELDWDDADGRTIVMTFPYATLVTAVDSLGDDDELPRWRDLRTQLRQHPNADTVSIKRYWGW